MLQSGDEWLRFTIYSQQFRRSGIIIIFKLKNVILNVTSNQTRESFDIESVKGEFHASSYWLEIILYHTFHENNTVCVCGIN